MSQGNKTRPPRKSVSPVTFKKAQRPRQRTADSKQTQEAKSHNEANSDSFIFLNRKPMAQHSCQSKKNQRQVRSWMSPRISDYRRLPQPWYMWTQRARRDQLVVSSPHDADQGLRCRPTCARFLRTCLGSSPTFISNEVQTVYLNLPHSEGHSCKPYCAPIVLHVNSCGTIWSP